MKRKKILSILLFTLIFISILIRIDYALSKAYLVNDQGRDLSNVIMMIKRGKPLLIGPPTSLFTKLGNIPFGPYYYYVLAIPLFISRHPFAAEFIFILFYSIILFMVMRWKRLSLESKLIFILLFGFALNSIYHTTFIWNLNLAGLAAFILYLFAKHYQVIFEKPFPTAIYGFLLGAVFQIHYGVFFLVTVIFLKIFLKKNLSSLLYLSLGFALSFLPFVIFDIRHQFPISRMLMDLPKEAGRNNMQIDILSSLLEISKFAFPIFTNSDFLHIIIFSIILFILLKDKNRENKLTFIFFLFTFILLRRKFNYYAALYIPFLYLALSQSRTKFVKNILMFFSLAVALNSIFKYTNDKNTKFGIKTQIQIAKEIAKNNPDKTFNLSALPHDDDKKGVLYLLENLYKIKNIESDKDSYLICYDKTKCALDNKEIIFENNKVLVIKD